MIYPNIYDGASVRTSGTVPKHDGIGTLADVISCTVTCATDGTFELDLQYPASGLYAEHLLPDNLIGINLYKLYVEKQRKRQFFRIATTERSWASSGDIITVHAEHISYDLKWAWCEPTGGEIVTLDGCISFLQNNGLGTDVFTFQNIAGTRQVTAGFNKAEPFTKREGIIELCEMFGVCAIPDNLTVRFYKPDTSAEPYPVQKGKSLVDFTASRDLSQAVTGVYMYFYNDDSYMPPLLITPNGKDSFGVPHYIAYNYNAKSGEPLDNSVVELVAEQILDSEYTAAPKTTYTAHLADTGDREFTLCDMVRLCVPELNLDDTDSILQVQKITYDALTERYDSIEVGSLGGDITDIIAALAKRS